jgi:hypothetical protein
LLVNIGFWSVAFMSNNNDSGWDKIPSLNLTMDEDYSERLKAKEARLHSRSDLSSLKKVLHGDVSSIPVRMATAAHGTFDGFIEDISEGGCRVTVQKKLTQGELAKIRFAVDNQIILTKSVIRWASAKNDGCIAGVEFKDMPSDQKEILGAICSASKLSKVGKIK